MKEITFDKEAAYKYRLAGLIVWTLIEMVLAVGAWWVYKSFVGIDSDIANFSIPALSIPWLTWSVIWIYNALNAVWIKIRINSARYYMEEHKLVKEWKVITKSIDIARLQVINTIMIDQGLFEKLFGLFSLTVDYGFGSEGYNFTYNYLDEKTCMEIEEYLKSNVQGIPGVKLT